MRRALLAGIASLALAAVSPWLASADATAQFTLACGDGTSLTNLVDPTTLIDVSGEIQPMINIAGGFSCTSLDQLVEDDSTLVQTVGPCQPTDLYQDGRYLNAWM
jgi:hypothetical protein